MDASANGVYSLLATLKHGGESSDCCLGSATHQLCAGTSTANGAVQLRRQPVRCSL